MRGANECRGPHITSGEAAPANAAQGAGVRSWKAQPPPSTSVPSTPSPPPPLPRLDPRSHPIRPLSAPRSEKRLRTEHGPADRRVCTRVESRGVGARNPPFFVQEAKGQRDTWGRTAAQEVEGAILAGLGSGGPGRIHRHEPAAGCRHGHCSLRAVVGRDFVCGEPGAAALIVGSAGVPRPRAVGPRCLEPWATRVSLRPRPPFYPQRGPALPSLREVLSPSWGRRPGCSLSSCAGDMSCGVQDLLHGFDSNPDKLYLALFEIFKRNYSKDF